MNFFNVNHQRIKTMNQQKLRIKKLDKRAVVPKYAKPGDAGMDLTAIDGDWDVGRMQARYRFGLAFEIPEGYVGLIFPRSSIVRRTCSLANAVGVIDSGYRGEVTAVFNLHGEDFYAAGERIAQLVVVPFAYCEIEETDELSETERGVGGYGSTGK